MFNWFRPRRPARPTPRVSLSVEPMLEDRTVLCMGADCMMMTAAQPPAAVVSQPAAGIPADPAVTSAAAVPVRPAAVAPSAAVPPAVTSAVGPSDTSPVEPDSVVPTVTPGSPVAVASSREPAADTPTPGLPQAKANETNVFPLVVQPTATEGADRW